MFLQVEATANKFQNHVLKLWAECLTSPLQQQQKRDDDDSKPSRGNAADVFENLITSAYLEADGPWRLAESLHDFLILGSVPAISKLFSLEHSNQAIGYCQRS